MTSVHTDHVVLLVQVLCRCITLASPGATAMIAFVRHLKERVVELDLVSLRHGALLHLKI